MNNKENGRGGIFSKRFSFDVLCAATLQDFHDKNLPLRVKGSISLNSHFLQQAQIVAKPLLVIKWKIGDLQLNLVNFFFLAATVIKVSFSVCPIISQG